MVGIVLKFKEWVRVKDRKGSMIIWDSRLMVIFVGCLKWILMRFGVILYFMLRIMMISVYVIVML